MKIKKILIIVLILFVSVLIMSCTGTEKPIKKIQIVDNSFKSSYILDEQLSLASAKILVTYKDGTTEVVKITQDMVRGFDTATSGTQKILTVTYRGFSVSFSYNVVTSVSVDTAFRLTMSSGEEDNRVSIVIRSLSVELVEGGVYAVSFDITLTGCSFVSLSSLMGEGFKISHKLDNSLLKVLIYSEKGDVSASASGNIAKLTVIKNPAANTKRVALTNIRMSDGQKDYVSIPAYIINI